LDKFLGKKPRGKEVNPCFEPGFKIEGEVGKADANFLVFIPFG